MMAHKVPGFWADHVIHVNASSLVETRWSLRLVSATAVLWTKYNKGNDERRAQPTGHDAIAKAALTPRAPA